MSEDFPFWSSQKLLWAVCHSDHQLIGSIEMIEIPQTDKALLQFTYN